MGRWGDEACAAAQPAAGRQEQAVSPALVWAAGSRRGAVEEVAGPFDSNPMVTAARIVCSLTKPCVNKSASKSVACTAHLLLFL